VPGPPYVRKPTLPEWRDCDPDLTRDLASADPYACVGWLLDMAPKASGSELVSELERLGGPTLTAKTGRKWREAIKAGQRSPPGGATLGDDPEAPRAPTAAQRALEAVAIGDQRGAAGWARTAKDLAETGIRPAEDEDAPDWERLTEQQFSALRCLVGIAKGEVPDEECLWWRALFGRVPEGVTRIHPAHVDLPKGGPLPERLTVP
jgi:hypothetical protein